MARPPLDYETRPESFETLYESVLGQERRELAIGNLPHEECVVVTAGAMMDLVTIVADLRERVSRLEND